MTCHRLEKSSTYVKNINIFIEYAVSNNASYSFADYSINNVIYIIIK
jgi:hypothetical protein